MGTLLGLGLVHPAAAPAVPAGAGKPYPFLNLVNWGPAVNTSASGGATSPAAAMHPINPLWALSGGNLGTGAQINVTTDGGTTWLQRTPPQPSSLGQWCPGLAGCRLFRRQRGPVHRAQRGQRHR